MDHFILLTAGDETDQRRGEDSASLKEEIKSIAKPKQGRVRIGLTTNQLSSYSVLLYFGRTVSFPWN